MADIDYTAVVRKMKTSDLLACLMSTRAARTVIDSDGAIDTRIRGDDLTDAVMAEADLVSRGRILVSCAAAELDRRIPIPESEPRCTCTTEEGDSRCARHPTCAGCGIKVERVDEICEECQRTPSPQPDPHPRCSRKHTAPRARAGSSCDARITPYNAKTSEPCRQTSDLVRVGDRDLCSAHAWCRACQRPIVAEDALAPEKEAR